MTASSSSPASGQALDRSAEVVFQHLPEELAKVADIRVARVARQHLLRRSEDVADVSTVERDRVRRPRSSCSVWTPTTRRLRSCRPLGGRLEVPLDPPPAARPPPARSAPRTDVSRRARSATPRVLSTGAGVQRRAEPPRDPRSAVDRAARLAPAHRRGATHSKRTCPAPCICERTAGRSLHPLKLCPTPSSETQYDQQSVPARVNPASVPAGHQLTVAGRCAGAGTRVTR
jgi:hypothetical protein